MGGQSNRPPTVRLAITHERQRSFQASLPGVSRSAVAGRSTVPWETNLEGSAAQAGLGSIETIIQKLCKELLRRALTKVWTHRPPLYQN